MRNIVMIFVDSLRPDHLGCYGYERPTSPFLDKLAQRSLVLDACYSASNYTAPAFTSVFTATHPGQHGIFGFFARAGQSAIKDVCAQQGIRTAGIVTFRFLRNLLGDIWGPIEAVTDSRSFNFSKDLPRAVSEGACEWLEHYGRKGPFCLFLHYNGPHVPYRLPDQYATLFDTVAAEEAEPEIVDCFFPQHKEVLGASLKSDLTLRRLRQRIRDVNYHHRRPNRQTVQFLIDKYDASIKYHDDMLTQVHAALQSLGLLDQTILAVFSDHGEEFLDHGHLGHGGVHVYEEIIRTVGIIHDPSHPDGRRNDLPVSHVQILPTLLELAGAESLPPALSDLSISRTMARAKDGGLAEPVFCIGRFKSAVRLGRLKWIRFLPSHRRSLFKRLRLLLRMIQIGEGRNELFDLVADPGERTPLRGRRNQVRPLAAALRHHLKSASFPPGKETPKHDLSQEERQKIEQELKGLGYM